MQRFPSNRAKVLGITAAQSFLETKHLQSQSLSLSRPNQLQPITIVTSIIHPSDNAPKSGTCYIDHQHAHPQTQRVSLPIAIPKLRGCIISLRTCLFPGSFSHCLRDLENLDPLPFNRYQPRRVDVSVISKTANRPSCNLVGGIPTPLKNNGLRQMG